MDHVWRRAPALLAGAGVLAATLNIVGLLSGHRRPWAPAWQQPAGSAGTLARPGIPEGAPVATLPSEALARAIERAARGVVPEPYFVDPTEAARFLDRWRGRLVEGKALVAMADQFDAGAENGHAVPVTLWLDSGSRVMGLTGEAAFEPMPGGLRLRSLQLEPLDLAVASWAEAARRAGQGAAGEVLRSPAPFYGVFRFTMGGHRWAINARTGEVSAE
jgi:hypothetical protein